MVVGDEGSREVGRKMRREGSGSSSGFLCTYCSRQIFGNYDDLEVHYLTDCEKYNFQEGTSLSTTTHETVNEKTDWSTSYIN